MISLLGLSGDPWSPSGIGDGVTGILYSVVNQIITIADDTNSIRLWFAGNGSGSALVYSAYVTQGAKSVPISVGGKFSTFTIPSNGRWSDYISVADFALPGEVTFTINYVAAVALPTFSGYSTPTDPVPISAIEAATQLPVSSSTPSSPGSTLILDNFNSNQYWGGISSEGFAYVVEDGKMKISGTGVGYSTPTMVSGNSFPKVPAYNRLSFQCDLTMNDLPEATFTPIADRIYIYNYAYLQVACDKYHFGGTLYFTDVGVYSYQPMLLTPIKIAGAAASYSVKIIWDGTTANQYCSIYINDVLCHNFSASEYHATSLFSISVKFSANISDALKHIDFDVDNLLVQGDMGVPYTSTASASPSLLTETPYTGTIRVSTNPSAGETITITNSATTVFTFVDHYPVNAGEVQIGATKEETANNLSIAINNISGGEFVATVSGYTITVKAYTETEFSATTTSGGITASITGIVPGLITEDISAADDFTATLMTKYVDENASAADLTDGLIDGLSESASASDNIDCLTDSMDENANASAATDNFDGLIEYMGEEVA